jgi:DNA-binding MarR family transcriptional regulator
VTGEDGFHVNLQALFAEVTALANQLRKTAARVHREDNSPGGGWGILQVLERLGPQTVPGIARIRTLSRQNIQTLVNRLESHGYVALIANPAHKRSALVRLTDAGRILLATAGEREADSLERLRPQIPEARLLPTARLLRRLRLLLTDTELPADESGGRRPSRERLRTLRKPARRRGPSPAPAESPEAPAESGLLDESEFPVNLL